MTENGPPPPLPTASRGDYAWVSIQAILNQRRLQATASRHGHARVFQDAMILRAALLHWEGAGKPACSVPRCVRSFNICGND